MTLTDIISKATRYAKKVIVNDTSGGGSPVSINTTTSNVTIDSSCNVGIGITSPSISGVARSTITSSNGTTIVKSQTTANSGLNSARFDLATGTPNSFVIMALKQNGSAPFYQIAAGSSVQTAYYDFPSHIFRNSSGVEWMRINTSGNVGIGTSLPGKKLDVSGTVRLQALPTYVNNAAAVAGGLSVDELYKTSSGEIRIVV